MKTRKEAAEFINKQLHSSYDCPRKKGEKAHYGLQELRVLLDFLYEGLPQSQDELLGPGQRWT